MAEIVSPVQPVPSSRAEQMFPTLTPAPLARIAARGRVRAIQQGEVLVEAGQPVMPSFVVLRGTLEIVQPAGDSETPIVTLGPGQFTGEINLISGWRTLVRARRARSSSWTASSCWDWCRPTAS